MSESLDRIKGELSAHKASIEADERSRIEAEKVRIEKDKALLSETVDIFKEIRQDGLVSWTTEFNEHGETSTLNSPNEDITSEFIAAKLVLFTPLPEYTNNYAGPFVFSALLFNRSIQRGEWGGIDGYGCEMVAVAVVDGKPSLVRNCEHILDKTKPLHLQTHQHRFDFKPIQDGRLVESIVEGMKDPLVTNLNDINSISDDWSQQPGYGFGIYRYYVQ